MCSLFNRSSSPDRSVQRRDPRRERASIHSTKNKHADVVGAERTAALKSIAATVAFFIAAIRTLSVLHSARCLRGRAQHRRRRRSRPFETRCMGCGISVSSFRSLSSRLFVSTRACFGLRWACDVTMRARRMIGMTDPILFRAPRAVPASAGVNGTDREKARPGPHFFPRCSRDT